MKRWIAALALLALLASIPASAEGAMAELRNMRKSAGDRILELESVPTPTPDIAPEPTPTSDAVYEPLSPGTKGDEVREMQQRLINLGYLSGKADGNYGAKTTSAIKAFQSAAELPATGEADGETLRRLFMTTAPVRIEYAKLNYSDALDTADEYAGTLVAFSGSVLQVLESDQYADTLGVYTALRVATKGGYDNVVYATCFRPASAPPIREGDTVKVFGAARGLYAYDTEAGSRIVLPRIEADAIETPDAP